MALKTVFGWIIADSLGSIPNDTDKAHVSLCTAECDTDVLLRKFWENEEIPQKLSFNDEDEQCERHFVSTHSRTEGDRYVMRLPFKAGHP
jgi:hypothetical protein